MEGYEAGISTLLMTWMMPFEAITSVVVTFVEPFRKTLAAGDLDLHGMPAAVFTDLPLRVTTVLAGTAPLTTW